MPTILNGIGIGYINGTTVANATNPVLKAIHGKVGVGAAYVILTQQRNRKGKQNGI
jgi:hypothetical protein